MSELKINIIKSQIDGSGIIDISGPIALKTTFKSLSLEHSRGCRRKQLDDGFIESVPDDDDCIIMVFET